MNRDRLRRVGKVLALLFGVACAVVFLLPVGGCATQSVLHMRAGRCIGTEGFLPPENVTQSPDQNTIMRILYRDTSIPRPFLLETTIAPSNMLSYIETAPRQTADNIPIVDVISCIAMGQNRWLDKLPSNAVARFAACPWKSYRPGKADAWYASNSFTAVHSLRLENQPLIVAFRGRSKSYEEWAWWSTPFQDILLVPAICWDAITAIFQIPIFLARDMVHAALSLGDPGNENPWRHPFHKPPRHVSPRILNPQRHRVLMIQANYDDIQYAEAAWQHNIIISCWSLRSEPWDRQVVDMQFKSCLAPYKRYLAQMPNGRHVPDAIGKIAQIEEAKDYRKEGDAPDSHDSLQDLQRYIETHSSSKYTESAKATMATMTSNVTVEVDNPAFNSSYADISSRHRRTFVVGVTKRAFVESFIGPGVSVVSSNSPGASGYVWQVQYMRGKALPPYTSIIPARPLGLMFDTNDVLLEISGD